MKVWVHLKKKKLISVGLIGESSPDEGDAEQLELVHSAAEVVTL